MPGGNSIAKAALKYTQVIQNGFKEDMDLMTRLFLSTNKTSMGKRIKKVCIEVHGFSIMA